MSPSHPAAFAIIKHLRQRGLSKQDAIAAVGEYGAALDDFLSARTDEIEIEAPEILAYWLGASLDDLLGLEERRAMLSNPH